MILNVLEQATAGGLWRRAQRLGAGFCPLRGLCPSWGAGVSEFLGSTPLRGLRSVEGRLASGVSLEGSLLTPRGLDGCLRMTCCGASMRPMEPCPARLAAGLRGMHSILLPSRRSACRASERAADVGAGGEPSKLLRQLASWSSRRLIFLRFFPPRSV